MFGKKNCCCCFGEWRQQFVVTEAFKQIELKICNKVLYFSK